MREKFKGDAIFLKENQEDNLEKYEEAIRKLIGKFIESNRNNQCSPQWKKDLNFDISDPHREDMEKFWSGDFEIDKFNMTPKPESEGKYGKSNFHFYIGNTELHITGSVADRVYELLENKEK